jgi:hypothetical protein
MVLQASTTALYYDAKRLNREFVAVAKQLQALKSIEVYHTGRVPKGVLPLPQGAPFRIETGPKNAATRTSNDGLLMGCFGSNNLITHALVVNTSYKVAVGSTNTAGDGGVGSESPLMLVGPGLLEIFDVAADKWTAAKSNQISLRLPPGGGVLVRAMRQV